MATLFADNAEMSARTRSNSGWRGSDKIRGSTPRILREGWDSDFAGSCSGFRGVVYTVAENEGYAGESEVEAEVQPFR